MSAEVPALLRLKKQFKNVTLYENAEYRNLSETNLVK